MGNTVCQEVTIAVNVGVPESAATLTSGKSSSSVMELPPPLRVAVSDGKKNADSDNFTPGPALNQSTEQSTVEEAKREDVSPGHPSRVGLGASERDNGQKGEAKQVLPLGNTDVH